MANSIYLEERKVNNIVTEGSLTLNMHPELTKDIVLEIDNVDGVLLSGESLESGEYSIPILGSNRILLPVNNESASNGKFKVSNYTPSPTYTKVPDGYILEIATDMTFTNIIKTLTRNDFLEEFSISFDTGGVVLYARTRTYTSAYASNPSPIVKFKLVENYVNKPMIVSPINNSTGNAWELQVTLSDYSYIGSGNYCDGLVYELALDSDFTNLVGGNMLFRDENLGEIIDYNDYVKTFMLNGLGDDTTYYLRVAYIGKITGIGEWSDVTTFRTYDLPDMEVTSNINTKIIVNKEVLDNIMVTSNNNIINITKTNNKIEILSNVDITFNEPDLLGFEIKKVLNNIDNDIFIFGTMIFGGSDYIGPLKKQFIAVYRNNGDIDSISIEVHEDIETVDNGGVITMVPYVSKVDIKDVIIKDDVFLVFGTIPHSYDVGTIMTSCYVINSNLDILTFKNFSKDNKLVIDKLVFNNNNVITGIGTSEGDVGYGNKTQSIVISFNVDENNNVSVNNAKIFSNSENSLGGGILNYNNNLIATIISHDTNMYMTHILKLDEYNNLIDYRSFNTYDILLNNLYDNYGNIRMTGKNGSDGILIDVDIEDNYKINLGKTFIGSGEISNSLFLTNNLISINKSSGLLILNSDIDIDNSDIVNLDINNMSIINGGTITTSEPTITNVTHEPIKKSISGTVSNGTNALTKINI